ncbi:DUF1971 domain-containing protein [Thalassomonas sp. RHCl1]|uniref:DUF1971 domain-containing protein n=1 Tax=Thalassomonas sp. RHCl1 TaxID=2995320 RepID=UPI00248C3E95|nr:DUF1971 domain-containing protein [Thalassomonas sp. RHCl1]
MSAIPEDYVNYKSTQEMTVDNVPKMFLHLHNTRAGVYGKICVLNGQLKFYGFADRRGDVEQEIIIEAGDFAVSPPEYWHKVEFLSDTTRFRVDFYAQKDSDIVVQNRSERHE